MKLRSIVIMKKMMFTLDEIKNILKIDEKIDKAFNSDYVDKETISELILQVKSKYKEVLEIEKDINSIKIKLEEIINKSEVVIKE